MRMKFLFVVSLLIILCGCFAQTGERRPESEPIRAENRPDAEQLQSYDRLAAPEPEQIRTDDANQRNDSAEFTEEEERDEPEETEEISFIPVRLRIPSIGLDTIVEPVGILENGHMGVPKKFDRVGILSPWTKPGEPGNAVIAGHLDHYTGPAIFYHLRKLKKNDKVTISDQKGNQLTYTVKSVESYKTEEAPLERIFGEAETSNLNLITCTGKFDKKKREHNRRLVVFTELEWQ